MVTKEIKNIISHQLPKLLLIVLIATIVTSCATKFGGGAAIVAAILRTPLEKQMAVENDEIKILARDFLKVSDSGYGGLSGYGYYMYLLFTEKGSGTYQLRKSVAMEFMCQFSDSSEIEKIGIKKGNVAVFYAPVKENTDTYMLEKSESGDALLDNYNYTYAQALINMLTTKKHIKDFTVGIIAYPKPLRLIDDNPNLDGLEIIDLSKTPPIEAAVYIRKLRNAVLSKDYMKKIEVPITEPDTNEIIGTKLMDAPRLDHVITKDFATEFRKILASLGEFMSIAGSAEAATCK